MRFSMAVFKDGGGHVARNAEESRTCKWSRRPLEAKSDFQSTASKQTGISVLQTFCQQPECTWKMRT